MPDLFALSSSSDVSTSGQPLADLLRPQKLADVIGQSHLLGGDGALTTMLAAHKLGSLIFWGPPGVGKTTIARLLAYETDAHFVQISAIFSGVSELRKVFDAAKMHRSAGQNTVLFVDEIHRFNKSQQDSFLPHMEDGTIVLLGATTENPSFELNAAILSRAQVLVLERLSKDDLELLTQRAERCLDTDLPLTKAARQAVIDMADGDGRVLLNLLEQIMSWHAQAPISPDELGQRLSRRAAQYDKSGDAHYNLISALHKSIRGSDPDAALYWLARMLKGGEDPRYLARRLTRMAIEDIGLADTQAHHICLSAWQIYERLGTPEGELALAEAVVYLALAPKSNAAYIAYKSAMKSATQTGSHPPPKHILNAPTQLMKEQGYGADYDYDHDAEDAFSGQNYFPEKMERAQFYAPVERGFERDLKKRIDYFAALRAKRQRGKS